MGGGGIWSDNLPSSLTLNNSTVSDNTSNHSGGGIEASSTVTLTNSAIKSNSAAFQGGGILSTRAMIITNSIISGNISSGRGGGIFASGGTVTIKNSTITANGGGGGGGGIFNAGTVALINSTITLNNAGGPGGGGILASGTVTLTNTIIANSRSGGNCTGTINSLGHNLDTDGTCSLTATGDLDLSNADPRLGPLQDNGGPTFTHALLPGSPAIDGGDDSVLGPPYNLTTDQRGEPRLQGAHVDIGAFESPSVLTVPAPAIVGTAFCSTGSATMGRVTVPCERR